MVGEPDDVLVGVAELTQARRAVEDGAPVSRAVLGVDGGGDLPGWAAEAARWDGERGSFMAITPRGWLQVGQRMVPAPRQMRQRWRLPVQVVRAPSPLQAGQRTYFIGLTGEVAR